MAAQLQAWADKDQLPFSWTTWNKQVVTADPAQCGRYRPDFIFLINDEERVVVLELDEHAHLNAAYPLSCELARQAEIALSFGGRPVVLIRYNPDTIKTQPYIKAVPKKERDARLLTCLQEALAPEQRGRFDNHLAIEYLFYPPIFVATAAKPQQAEWRQRFAFARVQPDYEAWAFRVLAQSD